MEGTIFYLLIRQKYINSKQKTIPYPFCLGNISKDFAVNNMKKNSTEWIHVQFFC